MAATTRCCVYRGGAKRQLQAQGSSAGVSPAVVWHPAHARLALPHSFRSKKYLEESLERLYFVSCAILPCPLWLNSFVVKFQTCRKNDPTPDSPNQRLRASESMKSTCAPESCASTAIACGCKSSP